MSDEEPYSVERTRKKFMRKHQAAKNWGLVWGLLIFFGTWIGCMSEYGFLFGFGLGWLPASILGFLTGVSVFYIADQ